MEQCWATAADLYGESVECGNPDAMFELAKMYRYGCGVEKDEEEAVFLLERSSDHGNHRALLMLAHCVRHGYGVEKNLRDAKEYYESCAESEIAIVCETAKQALAELQRVKREKKKKQKKKKEKKTTSSSPASSSTSFVPAVPADKEEQTMQIAAFNKDAELCAVTRPSGLLPVSSSQTSTPPTGSLLSVDTATELQGILGSSSIPCSPVGTVSSSPGYSVEDSHGFDDLSSSAQIMDEQEESVASPAPLGALPSTIRERAGNLDVQETQQAPATTLGSPHPDVRAARKQKCARARTPCEWQMCLSTCYARSRLS